MAAPTITVIAGPIDFEVIRDDRQIAVFPTADGTNAAREVAQLYARLFVVALEAALTLQVQ